MDTAESVLSRVPQPRTTGRAVRYVDRDIRALQYCTSPLPEAVIGYVVHVFGICHLFVCEMRTKPSAMALACMLLLNKRSRNL
jgi:hypothetical protein